MQDTDKSDIITTLYSPEEVADILQLGLSSTYSLLRSGKLKSIPRREDMEDLQTGSSGLYPDRK